MKISNAASLDKRKSNPRKPMPPNAKTLFYRKKITNDGETEETSLSTEAAPIINKMIVFLLIAMLLWTGVDPELWIASLLERLWIR